MRFLVFEDDTCQSLAPIALMRPVFELLCGRQCLRSRLQAAMPKADWGVYVRPWLADVYAERHPDCHVNDCDWAVREPLLLINGRWIPDGAVSTLPLTQDSAGLVGDDVAWVAVSGSELKSLECRQVAARELAERRMTVDAGGTMIRHPWDLVNRNPTQLDRDFSAAGMSQIVQYEHVQCLGDPTDLYVSERAIIDPYVVIDVRHGPVSIAPHAHVQSFTRIEGPSHIGAHSQLFRANVRSGTTIGPVCRVGGEIEHSILHGYVNKYHEGFLGHSYVCPWVNLGAITTTSDLKNDYSPIKVPLQGRPVETGTNKVGTFIGDFSRTAIDSMFNTGTSVGVMCGIVPGAGLLPRHVPSFSNVMFGELVNGGPIARSLESARIAMQRRDRELTPALEAQLRHLHSQSDEERAAAIVRATRLRNRSR